MSLNAPDDGQERDTQGGVPGTSNVNQTASAVHGNQVGQIIAQNVYFPPATESRARENPRRSSMLERLRWKLEMGRQRALGIDATLVKDLKDRYRKSAKQSEGIVKMSILVHTKECKESPGMISSWRKVLSKWNF